MNTQIAGETIKFLIVSFLLLFFTSAVFAQEPSSNPPTGNTNPPLNTSGTGQTKTGALVISGGASLGALIVNGSSTFNGNVGIGTTSPSAKLHIDHGGNAVPGGGVDTFALATSGSYGGGIGLVDGAGNWGIYTDGNGANLRFSSGSNYGGLSTRVTFTSGGNVGIGTTNPSGSLKLDVEGSIGATQYCDNTGANCVAASALGSGGGGTGTADNLGNHTATQTLNMGSQIVQFSSTENRKLNLWGSNYGLGISNGSLDLYTGRYVSFDDGYGGNRNAQIAANGSYNSYFAANGGDVGIGVTNPAGRLHIVHDAGDRGTIFRGGYIDSVNAANSAFAKMDFRAASFEFINGNVGIGVAPSTLRLRVDGSVGAAQYCDSAGANCIAASTLASGGTGDNLGNHTAAQVLDMNGYDIGNANDVFVNQLVADGGFYIDGNEVISGGGGRVHTAKWNTNSNYGYFEMLRSDGTRGGYLGYGSVAGGYISLVADSGNNLYINSKVGIGTTSPSAKLHIDHGGNAVPGGGVDTFALATSGSYGGGIGLVDGAGNWGIYTDGNGANLRFSSGSNYGGLSARVTFTTAGRVNATQYCDQNGNSCFSPSSVGGGGDNLGSHTATQGLNMNGWNIVNANNIQANNGVSVDGNTVIDGSGQRSYLWGGAPTAFFIDSDQRGAMIHVNANQFYVLRGCGAGDTGWCSGPGGWPLYINLDNNNAYFGQSVSATAFVYSSDRRLKKNIQNFETNRSQNLLKLNTYTFDWKDDRKQGTDIGLIAQEVQEYFPEFVGEDDKGNLNVDYPKLTVPLIGLVKEQQSEIDQLKERLLKIENQL